MNRSMISAGKSLSLCVALYLIPTGSAIAGDKDYALPIDGEWTLKVILPGGLTSEVSATIKNRELRFGDEKVYWKNMKQISKSKYSAIRVSPGVFYGIYEHPVEFYLDADGVLHHDDGKLGLFSRSYGLITLSRKP